MQTPQTAPPPRLFPKGAEWMTVAQVQARLAADIAKGTGCPCCGQHVKDYKWSLLAPMAASLMWMVRQAKRTGRGDIHMNGPDVPDFIKRSRSFPKLVHWGLVRPVTKAALLKDKRWNGQWNPTMDGVEFAHNRLQVPAWVRVYNNTCVERSFTTVGVRDALGKRFNYDELVTTWNLH